MVNINSKENIARARKNNHMLAPIVLVVMFAMGFYLGMNMITEPYISWYPKVGLLFIASILMIVMISFVAMYATKNIDLGMVARTNTDQNLWMSAICFYASTGIGVVLLIFDSSDRFAHGLYGGMLIMVVLGIITIGAFAVHVSRNLSRRIDLTLQGPKQ